MAHVYQLPLSEEQERELRRLRDHSPLPYVRVRAAAILKVAQGHSIRWVARYGLLKPVHPDRIREWIRRYRSSGADGLRIRSGRGRKPIFSPVHKRIETAAPDLQGVLYRSPRLYGLSRSRWWLDGVRQVVPWLSPDEHPISLPGLCKLLRRLGVSYKRGRRSVHSPDLEYDKKLLLIEQAKRVCQCEPEHFVFLYEDEFTYFKLPRVSFACAATGAKGRKAIGAGTQLRRIAACLDIASGAVIARQRNSYTVEEMYYFFRYVERHYPSAERIYIALDNWPVHFHPYVMENLEQRHSRIHFLRLPTYAPWTNPIEKLWLKLCQELLDQHDFGNDWKGRKPAIDEWLASFAQGSASLLHFVGLSP